MCEAFDSTAAAAAVIETRIKVLIKGSSSSRSKLRLERASGVSVEVIGKDSVWG